MFIYRYYTQVYKISLDPDNLVANDLGVGPLHRLPVLGLEVKCAGVLVVVPMGGAEGLSTLALEPLC